MKTASKTNPEFSDPPLESPRIMGLIDAMAAARRAVTMMTELQVDAVASCVADGDGFRAVVDVIEVPARLGDNDLISSYEVQLHSAGDITGFRRLRRYHREDPDGGSV